MSTSTHEFGIGQISVQPEWQRLSVATALFNEGKSKIKLVEHSYDWTQQGEMWAKSLTLRK